MSVNKVILVGHLGADPETRTFQNGGKIVNLRVAATESWKDRNTGERKERTEWVSVVLHAEHALSYAEKYLRKGSKVYVEGKLETRKWQDQQGNDRYSTEVTVRPFGGEIQGLDKRDNSGQRDNDRGQNSYGGQSGGYGGAASGGRNDFDDDIPFSPEWRL